ncbi:MAG: anaerobic sulfatase maturase [Candidatus Margulisbacteria bacterium]|nr:anaerobic sulfatase maturase [Candidatus Margulisiibacteriota bacterium]MBU1021584.1 anaerobic sulfatase maturase [Candidatus Margulisiibacteriota bacterium]MBU1728735.1 anaerobic sulfatase maturase [Candidatus Margulisiibacteriota bacterium]MBU1955186.1 anaerobic sulfatase maturase [Candidatus Margulisiibacteriota bacterium]
MANQLPASFHVITKPVGPACNLNCDYCFYLEKEKLFPSGKNFRMTGEVLEAFIRQYLESQPQAEVEFVWHGGEPLLADLAFYRQVLKLQKKYQQGNKIKNSLQTNGVLLNDAWAEFLSKNNFFVGISLDGTKEIHDIYRKDRSGRGTFDAVIKGLRLLKKHGVEFNVLACVAKETAYKPLEVYAFLKSEGVEFVQFTAVVERDPNGMITPWSVEPEKYGDFLIAIFDQWVRHDVGKIFVMNFEWALNNWAGNPAPLCLFAPECGRSLVIEHNGDVYSCDHFVYPEYLLGNVLKDQLKDLVELPKQKNFGAAKADKLPQYCKKCTYLFACRGECPKRRFLKTPSDEPGLNYLCAGYKKYFSHINKYMRGMVQLWQNNLPVSHIMKATKGPLVIRRDDQNA